MFSVLRRRSGRHNQWGSISVIWKLITNLVVSLIDLEQLEKKNKLKTQPFKVVSVKKIHSQLKQTNISILNLCYWPTVEWNYYFLLILCPPSPEKRFMPLVAKCCTVYTTHLLMLPASWCWAENIVSLSDFSYYRWLPGAVRNKTVERDESKIRNSKIT